MTQTIDEQPDLAVASRTVDELFGIYRTLLLARALDERMLGLVSAGRASSVVSCRGSEAAQIGSAAAARAGHDVVLAGRRDTAAVVALGMTPTEVLLSVLARAGDPSSGGRQLPQHWSSPALRIVSCSSHSDARLTHAAGMALASRLLGEDRVVLCYLDDDAVDRGGLAETLAFAGARRLPVVYVCERTAHGRTMSVPTGVARMTVDGADPLDVLAATEAALGRARRGDGPSLVQCDLGADPVAEFRDRLQAVGLLSDDHARRLEAEASADVDRAFRAADRAPAPAPGTRPPAEEDPAADVPAVGPERSVVDAIRQVHCELLTSEGRVAVLGRLATSGGVFGATEGLLTDASDHRVLDVDLRESALVGLGVGLALGGMRPIVEVPLADDLHDAFDQLVNEAAKLRYRSGGAFPLPLVIRCAWGAGLRGGPYRSQAVEAFFAHVPGLKVVAPSTPADAAGLLRAAVHGADPVLLLEHKLLYRLARGPVPNGDWRVPIGRAAVARPGTELTIVTYGLHRHLAVQAADALAGEGRSVEVIDLRTISPLDSATVLASARKTGRVLIVHEDNVSFGVGAEVAAIVAEHALFDLDAPIRRLAMPDVPAVPFAPSLERAVLIGVDEIVEATLALLAH
jgi:2-oxoisovalerate dehydrogenase E1 component